MCVGSKRDSGHIVCRILLTGHFVLFFFLAEEKEMLSLGINYCGWLFIQMVFLVYIRIYF